MQEDTQRGQHTEPEAPVQGSALIGTKNEQAKKSAGTKGDNKSGMQQKRGLLVAEEDIDDIFRLMSGGKETLGIEEFISVVNRLGLDLDDATVYAAFDFVKRSGFLGPDNRLGNPAFRAYVEHLSSVRQIL